MFCKKLGLAVVSLLLVTLSASAQTPAGTVTGRVADATGLPLPGAIVTLQGSDLSARSRPMATAATAFSSWRRGLQSDVGAQGFKPNVPSDIVVTVGQAVDLPVTLSVGGFDQTVNVAAPSPIVDAAQTGLATNIIADELTDVPTSRDPFALLRSVAGVLVDRVNVGGNETGQQATFVSKGTRPQDAVWTLDGVAITDMTLAGTSPTYFNYDNFEAIHVATAGQSIAQPTGGPGLDFIVKRGTNLFHGGARGYFDNDSLEASNVPAELAAEGVTPATGGSQRPDFGLRRRSRRTDGARQGLVLRLVLGAGRAPGAARRRAGRPDRAEESQREGELAGDAERHAQRPLLRRLQDQGQPQPRHRRHHFRRADRDFPSGQRVHRPVRCTGCSRLRTTASSAQTCSCRQNTPTTTPASC